jgi:hypothetical protein
MPLAFSRYVARHEGIFYTDPVRQEVRSMEELLSNGAFYGTQPFIGYGQGNTLQIFSHNNIMSDFICNLNKKRLLVNELRCDHLMPQFTELCKKLDVRLETGDWGEGEVRYIGKQLAYWSFPGVGDNDAEFLEKSADLRSPEPEDIETEQWVDQLIHAGADPEVAERHALQMIQMRQASVDSYSQYRIVSENLAVGGDGTLRPRPPIGRGLRGTAIRLQTPIEEPEEASPDTTSSDAVFEAIDWFVPEIEDTVDLADILND